MKNIKKGLLALTIMTVSLALSACGDRGIDLQLTRPTTTALTETTTLPQTTTTSSEPITVSQTSEVPLVTVTPDPGETTDESSNGIDETDETTEDPSEGTSEDGGPVETTEDPVTPTTEDTSTTTDTDPPTTSTTSTATTATTTTTASPTPAPTNTPSPVPTNTPSPAPTNTPSPVPTNTPTPVPTNTPTPIPNTPTPVPNTPTPVPNTPTPVPTNTPTPVPSPTPAGVPALREGQTVFENDYFVLSIGEILADRSQEAFEIEFVARTKGSARLTYIMNDVSVNGNMVLNSWTVQASPGETASRRLMIRWDELDKSHVTSIGELEYRLRVWETSNAEAIRYEGYGAILAEGANQADYPPAKVEVRGEQWIVGPDHPSANFIIEQSYSSDYYALVMDVYAKNKTGEQVQFAMRNLSIDGHEIPFEWVRRVSPGNQLYTEIAIDEALLAAAGVTEIRNVRFDLQVYNPSVEPRDYKVNQDTTYRP